MPSDIDVSMYLDLDILSSQLEEFDTVLSIETDSGFNVNATPCPPGAFCLENATEINKCASCKRTDYTVRMCSSTGNVVCSARCPVGMYGTYFEMRLCHDCSAGMFNDIQGASACSHCPDGKYAENIGQSACIDCPVGTYTSKRSGFTQCVQVIISLQYVFVLPMYI
jgi:hypothetical protein